jgi:single-strand DNA-binding protein
MASLNKATLIGNLGADPETRTFPSGDSVTNVRLATTESWKDKDGVKQERTEWHRIVFYRKLGEIAAEYLRKGSQIYVEGRITTKKWTDKEGIERYTTEIEASEMKMLGRREEGGASGGSNERQASSSRPAPSRPASAGGVGNAAAPAAFDESLDDIPFLELDVAFDPIMKKTSRKFIRC